LVRLCTTTSAPQWAGVMDSGVKVLSTTSDAPAACAARGGANREAGGHRQHEVSSALSVCQLCCGAVHHHISTPRGGCHR
jgi:hypothetical protein